MASHCDGLRGPRELGSFHPRYYIRMHACVNGMGLDRAGSLYRHSAVLLRVECYQQ